MPFLLLLFSLLARAAPEDTLDPGTRAMLEAAQRSEAAGDARMAAAGFKLVLSKDPTCTPAVLGLGRAQVELNQPGEAIATYETLPNDSDAVEALAHLIEDDDPQRAAALYRRLQTLRLGEPWPYLEEARSLTASDPLAAYASFQTYLGLLGGVEPDGDALVALAVALEEAGHDPEAVALLEGYLRDWPSGSVAQEARGRLERWAVEHLASTLAIGGDVPLPALAIGRVEEARRLAAAHREDDALSILRELVRLYPRSAEAWAALGDVHQQAGHLDQAELAYGWSVALAPEEAAWHARLGLLLAEAYGGRRDHEAAESLSRALALRPSWAEMQYRRGVIQQRLGSWDAAIKDLQGYLSAEPEGQFASDARDRLEALQRPVPEAPDRQIAGSCPSDVPAPLCDHYRVARVYQERGERGAARAELAPVLAEAPRWPAAQNLLAALELADGHPEDAVRAWKRSLELDPNQPEVLLQLGDKARREGRASEALDLLQRAADAGAGDAWYALAELAYADNRVDEASADLDRYFASVSGGLETEKALALRAEVRERIRRRQLGRALALGAALSALGVGLVWRASGNPLSALVRQAPESVHDLASVLAALRHEVLKHNTTLLEEVAGALERRDYQAVAFAADRLYGAPDTTEGGIIARFDNYLASLERIGRRHRVRLDLRRKDPVLAPMVAGLRRLRRLEGSLRRPWKTPPALTAELRRLSRLLNVDCYQAIGRFLREMSTLQITFELLDDVDERVRAEPAFSGQALPELELDVPEGGLPARILRGDLEDIVSNLLRNAYRAVGEGLAPGQRRVGLRMDEEMDAVTGLESVVLRFQDNAPGVLTDAIIRSRSIGRGLGLVVDLTTRHDGSVAVEREPGWAKAVVVRLPRAETPEGADAEGSVPGAGAGPALSWHSGGEG